MSERLDAPARQCPIAAGEVDAESGVDDGTSCVALSFLPIRLWRPMATRLRAGHRPAAVLATLLSEEWPLERAKVEELTSRAERVREQGAARGLTPLAWSHPDYPPPLAAIVDPPPLLWIRGVPSALERPAVAIVGSRAATPYALDLAERLAADLAPRGVTIVSGLARGVDSAAHRGALSAGGATIAVLGCGADVIYPAEHARLAREIETNGLILSELRPGTQPLPRFFPQRNRIISGLSRVVVVVEAGERSGSLITARCALDQGREVMAVPGNVLSGRNRGGHALLRDGAKIVESAEDILEELHEIVTQAPITTRNAAAADPLLACLSAGEACDLDEISVRSGLSPARLLPRLFELELQGVIRRAGGGRFIRFDKPC